MTAWHEGRRFYACVCGARDEETDAHPLESFDCWKCGERDSMKQWTPPGVMFERAQFGGMGCGKTDAIRTIERTAASLGEKVEHVRHARSNGQHGGHHCHWTGCEAKVPPAMWGCTKHWYMLPKSIRDRIWRTFRPGQEESKTPSREYVAAAREAQDWIAANHPPEPKQETFL